ncbi:ATP-binding protein [Pseudomonas syringae]|uniref:ATP-binding protein n=1 Tax=Pseudomonas syringae TaxID=317 RepID=UPI0002DCCB2A|nr:ATP-binding protein [Pseudomonas syringae]KOG03627.1 PAS/PAC sensor hybrid histidine kinase [Pseudomonas syringae pv. aceris]
MSVLPPDGQPLVSLPTASKNLRVPRIIGGGEMGDRVRGTDWSQTSLGDYDSWPVSLRTSLSMVLNAKGIAALYWGEQQWLLYNDAYGLALGDRHPRAFGQSMPEVLTDIAPVLSPQVAQVLETGEGFAIENLSMIMRRHGRDEETVWTYSFSPVQGEAGGFAGVLLLATEMTQQVLADRQRDRSEIARALAVSQLRDLNAQLEIEVNQRTADRNRLWLLSSDIMLQCTFEGVITAVNPAWTDLLGWHESELLGSSLFELIHPDDLDRTQAGASESSTGHAYPRFDNRYRHRDGSYRWISWATQPDAHHIYAVGRDFTVEHDKAEALATAEEALRQSQKMEAVGQLTGGLAHDFNNLLAGISGSLELMDTRIQQGRFNDVARYLAAAQGASKRAAALTQRLLAFSRRQTLEPKPTDGNRLIHDMKDFIQRSIGPAIDFQIIENSELWSIRVDAPQLENALLNLCLNARDAMPEGGKITIVTANEWLDESLLPSSNTSNRSGEPYIAFRISDTGSGMSPQIIARVFEPFFTTKPIGQGTGLGLSMVYGFVQQSGGQVKIASTVGTGTTISIYLPRYEGEVGHNEATLSAPDQPRSNRGATVLVVDDEPTVRMLVMDVLNDLGFSAFEAGDSLSGLKLLQSDVPIDLLITDVGLPGSMNGRQLADAARQSRAHLPILFITGYAEIAVLRSDQLEPGMAVMTKPFSIDLMKKRIQSLLEKA